MRDTCNASARRSLPDLAIGQKKNIGWTSRGLGVEAGCPSVGGEVAYPGQRTDWASFSAARVLQSNDQRGGMPGSRLASGRKKPMQT